MVRVINDSRGQGTVEAAFVIPVIFLLMLMLLQPGIILYDKIVMNSAACEAGRLLVTTNPATDDGINGDMDFVFNRLAAIPQIDYFHVHEGSGGCSWYVQLDDGEEYGLAGVFISTDLRPLPLFDVTLKLLGLTNDDGTLTISAGWASNEQPRWPYQAGVGSPADWVGAW